MVWLFIYYLYAISNYNGIYSVIETLINNT